MTRKLELKNLHVTRDGKEIVRGFSLTVPAGEVHALMGPNGSGKSSLANAIMGHPKYAITEGSVVMDGDDLTSLAVDERSRKGLFLSMQYPPEVQGVRLSHFLRTAVNAHREKQLGVVEFRTVFKDAMKKLGMDPSFGSRGVNEGFSGGEKKRAEILQLMMLSPKYAILDETDSGLDVDALKAVTEGINVVRESGMGIIVITHYTRILQYLNPDRVHVMSEGKIVASGTAELAHRIEKEGYVDIIGDTKS